MASAAPADFAFETTARPPSPFWALAEGRAIFEFGAFYMTRGYLSTLKGGDGHAVMVLPGFMASNSSTAPMRRLLKRLGYDAHGWDSGRNVRIDNALVERLRTQVTRLHEESGGKVSLIGWSLGGVLARELTKMHPELVRTVISLGSPISDDRNHTNARRLFEFFNGEEPEVLKDGNFEGLNDAPPVPTTSILTKTDGVVHWRGSVQHPADTPTENIEVYASHIGLGVNPSVMIAIADRLRQEEGSWKPFEPSLAQRWMFPKTVLS